ncbi:hypothetical protein Pelo_6371 [Pelomyxa schiedti]|nr:hypothetical protein Pelo_6371 [Pelomyxa schiedti]
MAQTRWTSLRPNILCSPDYGICIRSSSGHAAWLTHDGGNNKWLKPEQKMPFLMALRQANEQAGIVSPTDLLVCAHIHEHLITPDGLTMSLGCFNGDTGLQYGVLQEDSAGRFTVTFGHL